MFCHYCETNLPDDALFCNRCGRKLELSSQQESASRFSEQQDGPYASPSGSQHPQVDPTQDAVPSSSPSGSSPYTASGTAELSSRPPTLGASSRGISTLYERPPFQAPRPKSRRRIWMVLSSLVVVLLLLTAWGSFVYVNGSTPSKTLATVPEDRQLPNGLWSVLKRPQKSAGY